MAVMLMGLWRRVSESLDGMGRAEKEWGGMVSESYHDGSGLHKLESYSTPLSNPNFQHGISTPLMPSKCLDRHSKGREPVEGSLETNSLQTKPGIALQSADFAPAPSPLIETAPRTTVRPHPARQVVRIRRFHRPWS